MARLFAHVYKKKNIKIGQFSGKHLTTGAIPFKFGIWGGVYDKYKTYKFDRDWPKLQEAEN